MLTPACGAALLVASLSGCAEGPVKADPAIIAELRSRYLLQEEPDGALTPIGWREEQSETAESESAETPVVAQSIDPTEVVLVGQVGGMPNPWTETEPGFPWRENEATFFLVDPGTAADFADHAAEVGDNHAADCPFCAREAANKSSSVVAISFLGEDKKPTPIDSRELLGVSEGDTVVVRGVLQTLLGGELLVLHADGLFVRN